MSQTLTVARAYQSGQETIADTAATRILGLWGAVSPAAWALSWATKIPLAALVLTNAQRAAATGSDPYLEALASSYGAATVPQAQVNPAGFAGVSMTTGAPVAVALEAVSGTVDLALKAGASLPMALNAGAVTLGALVATEVADAGRAATSLAMFTRDRNPAEVPGVVKGPKGRWFVVDQQTGLRRPYTRPKNYVRLVEPNACARCVVLAGRAYTRAEAFLRHPRCRCTHVPVEKPEDAKDVFDSPQDYFDSLDEAEQDRVFTKAGARAIRDGADINQVVNSRRGMYTTADGRQATREGTTRRGLYGSSVRDTEGVRRFNYEGRYARLTPDQIYAQAATRDEALSLLRQYRYIF